MIFKSLQDRIGTARIVPTQTSGSRWRRLNGWCSVPPPRGDSQRCQPHTPHRSRHSHRCRHRRHRRHLPIQIHRASAVTQWKPLLLQCSAAKWYNRPVVVQAWFFPWKKNWAAPKAKKAVLGGQRGVKISKRALRASHKSRSYSCTPGTHRRAVLT